MKPRKMNAPAIRSSAWKHLKECACIAPNNLWLSIPVALVVVVMFYHGEQPSGILHYSHLPSCNPYLLPHLSFIVSVGHQFIVLEICNDFHGVGHTHAHTCTHHRVCYFRWDDVKLVRNSNNFPDGMIYIAENPHVLNDRPVDFKFLVFQ